MARVLAIDFGKVRIGLAISDELGIIAQVLPHVVVTGLNNACHQIAELCRDRGVGEILVGLPLSKDGRENEMCRNVRSFIERLRGVVETPIHLRDERLTTREATRVLLEADVSRKKRKGKVDSLSALILLQGHLDDNSGDHGGLIDGQS